MAHVKLSWNLLNVGEIVLEIVDLPCYLLRYLTICQKYIYKSVNNFVNREVGWKFEEEEREGGRRKLSSKFDIRFLLWSRMEWIVKWLQNGQIRGKIKEKGRERGGGRWIRGNSSWLKYRGNADCLYYRQRSNKRDVDQPPCIYPRERFISSRFCLRFPSRSQPSSR